MQNIFYITTRTSIGCWLWKA